MISERTTITLPGSPAPEGLVFRRFMGESDYPRMLAVINAGKVPDKIERTDTLEDIARNYAHLQRSDPYEDMVFIEVSGEVVGYSRVEWSVNSEEEWVGVQLAFLLPEWRGKGIGLSLLRYNEALLRARAEKQMADGSLRPDQPRFFEVLIFDSESQKLALFGRQGYEPVRHEQFMVRPDLENIPDAPMPPGLEVRDVLPEHYRAIWDAGAEAFKDHWGYVAPNEEDYASWLDDSGFQPDLWRVAWDGEQVAGMVQSFINQDENREYGRLRGWTEGICVRRPWRRKGLARSLLVQSLHRIKERGMQEAALTVDTQNLSGAFRIYESVGFIPVRRLTNYRKQF